MQKCQEVIMLAKVKTMFEDGMPQLMSKAQKECNLAGLSSSRKRALKTWLKAYEQAPITLITVQYQDENESSDYQFVDHIDAVQVRTVKLDSVHHRFVVLRDTNGVRRRFYVTPCTASTRNMWVTVRNVSGRAFQLDLFMI